MTPDNVYFATIEPIGPVLFGDNRSARAGVDHLQLDQDPSPLTLHAAVAKFIWDMSGNATFPAALGERVDDILEKGTKSVAELLGIAFREPTGTLWFPKPLHFQCRKEARKGHPAKFWSEDLLSPSVPDGKWKTSCALDSILNAQPLSDETEEALLISEHYLGRVLAGNVQREPLDHHARRMRDVFCSDMRPGIVIQNATGQTEEGMLFSRPYRRFSPASVRSTSNALGWGFAAWMATPGRVDQRGPGLGYLGGDRRRARFHLQPVSSSEHVLASLRNDVLSKVGDSSGFITYLLTPRIIEADSPWPEVNGAKPIAAATGRTQFTSGWNTKKHEPRRLLAVEPAGSVYFFSWPDGANEETRRSIVKEYWLSAVGRGAEAGFGRILLGVWR